MPKLDRRLISGLFFCLCVVAVSVTRADDPQNPNESLNPIENESESLSSVNEFDLSAEEIVQRAEAEEAKAPPVVTAAAASPPTDEPFPVVEEQAPTPVKSVTKPKPVVQQKGFNFTADFYGSHSSLMQFKGYQDDLSASLYLQFLPYRLVPFLRFLTSTYYYTPPGATESISDRRVAVGGGFDYRFTDWLRFRAMTEEINDKVAARTRQQESYGLIYNQYLQLGWLEMNNYAEAFYIPKLSDDKLDTFASVTLFHTFLFKCRSELLTFAVSVCCGQSESE